jgi:probable rRNA maturation factor
MFIHETAVQRQVPPFGVSDRAIKETVQTTLERIARQGEITIVCVDEKTITAINDQYRGKNKPTDVISFGYTDDDPDAPIVLGDIFLCIPILQKQAQEAGISKREECLRMLIHGVLHICGYDHMNQDDAIRMFTVQEEILESCLGRTPKGSDVFVARTSQS